MKRNRTFTFIMLFLIVSSLSACSSQIKTLNGKYRSTFNSEIYYAFNGENYSTNNIWKDISITDNGNGTYINNDGKIVTYINGDENYKYELGYLYNNYICSLWDGALPKTYEDTTLSNTLGDLILTYNLKSDKSYEYIVTSNNEVVYSENGTYTINNNEIVCVNEEHIITTFINVEDRVFCVEYVKE